MNTARSRTQAIACLLALAGTAQAHVTLEAAQAQAGAGYKAVLRVPHGCQGAATIRLSVQIPAGVFAVKPQPKPGWQIEITRGKYEQAYAFHGTRIEEGVRTITWSGGHLPDAYYEEFVFSSQLAPTLQPGAKLYFPTVQTCEQGVERWIEIPAAGKAWGDYEKPAPVLQLLAPRSPR